MTLRGREAWGPVLMMGLLQSALVACLPWLMERTALSAGVWSMIFSVGMLPVLLTAPLWGRLVDRQGAGRVSRFATSLVLAGFAMVLGVLITGVEGGLAVACLLLARLVHGLGAGGVFPAAQRLAVADAEPGQWSYRLSRLQMAVHAGRLAGPALVILAAWLPMVAVLIMAAVFAVLLVSGNVWQSSLVATPLRIGMQPAERLPLGRGWPFYLVAFLTTAWVGTLQFVLGPVLTSMAGVSAETGSSLTAVALVLASLVGLVFGPLIHARLKGVPMMFAWGGALLVAGMVLGLADSVSRVYLGVSLLAFGAAVLTPWYGSRLRQCQPAAQGEVAGRLTSTHTLGYIAGTLAGGWMLENIPESALTVFMLPAPALVLLAVWASRVTDRDRTVG